MEESRFYKRIHDLLFNLSYSPSQYSLYQIFITIKNNNKISYMTRYKKCLILEFENPFECLSFNEDEGRIFILFDDILYYVYCRGVSLIDIRDIINHVIFNKDVYTDDSYLLNHTDLTSIFFKNEVKKRNIKKICSKIKTNIKYQIRNYTNDIICIEEVGKGSLYIYQFITSLIGVYCPIDCLKCMREKTTTLSAFCGCSPIFLFVATRHIDPKTKKTFGINDFFLNLI